MLGLRVIAALALSLAALHGSPALRLVLRRCRLRLSVALVLHLVAGLEFADCVPVAVYGRKGLGEGFG